MFDSNVKYKEHTNEEDYFRGIHRFTAVLLSARLFVATAKKLLSFC